MNPPVYTIRKFDLSTMSKDSTICIIGRRRTGKSFLVRDMMHNYRSMPKGIVISRTESANPFFSGFIPDSFIYDAFSNDLLTRIINRQKRRIAKDGKSDAHRMYLIMDDCLSEANKWKGAESIKELFMNGRHLLLLYIVTLQYVMGIGPELRGNLDYIFIFKDSVLKNRKKLFENYGGGIPDFETFCDLMDRCTENYKCLVIHNSASSNKLEDMVYWYKAEPRSQFRVGSEEVWRFHNVKYDPHHSDKIHNETSLNLIQRYSLLGAEDDKDQKQEEQSLPKIVIKSFIVT